LTLIASGRHDDHRTAAAFTHSRDHRLQSENRAEHVDVEARSVVAAVGVRYRTGDHDTGVIDQHIGCAERLAALRDNVFPRRAVADVERREVHVLPVGAIGLWAREITDHHARTLSDEALGDRSSDATGPAADDCDLVRQSRAVVPRCRHRQLDPAGVADRTHSSPPRSCARLVTAVIAAVWSAA
jgi:hypothetical protein